MLSAEIRAFLSGKIVRGSASEYVASLCPMYLILQDLLSQDFTICRQPCILKINTRLGQPFGSEDLSGAFDGF